MFKRKVMVVLVILWFIGFMAAVFLMSCGKSKEQKQFAALADFEGAKMANISGTVLDRAVDAAVPNVEHQYFNNSADLVAALMSGKVDAITNDMPVAKHLVAYQSELAIFPDVVADDRYGSAVIKGSELGRKANEALQKLKDDGTIKQLEDIWFSTDESKKVLPKLNNDGSAGTIRYGCEVSHAPMAFVDANGKPTGFDLAVMTSIAQEMNMKLEIVTMNFDALLPSLASGKVDFVGGSMSMTEERLKSVDFVGPYYEGGIVLVVKKDRLGK